MQFIFKCYKLKKNNPLLFLHNSLIIYTLLGLLIILLDVNVLELLIIHTILLILTFIILIPYLRVHKHELLNCLPLILLHIFFLTIVYHCLPVLGSISSFMFIVFILLLCSGLYTLFLLRSNTKIYIPNRSIWESLKQLWECLKLILKDPLSIFLLILIFIICFTMRYIILVNISFTLSLLYFCLFYLIIFSLWLPCLLINHTLTNYYYNKSFDYTQFKQEFNLENLKKIFLFISISFSVKCLVFLVLDITLFHYKSKAFDLHYNKYLRSIKDFFSNYRNCNYAKTRAVMPSSTFVFGTPLLFDQDKNYIYNWKPQGFIELLKNLESQGYKHNEVSRLILPDDYSINSDKKVLNQLGNLKDSDRVYVTTSMKGAELLSYMKAQCTKTLNRQLGLFRVRDFPSRPVRGVIDILAVQKELGQMSINSKEKNYTPGFMNMLFTYFFKAEEGYILSPQKKQTGGQVDFFVKRKDVVICLIESKGLNARNYPLTHLFAPVTEYANTNHSLDTNIFFTIANKGPFISFGMYIQDFHCVNNLDVKSILFDGYIGLQVDKNWGVKPTQQINVFEPNHILYKAGDSYEQNKSIYRCIEFIKHHSEEIHAKLLGLGPKRITNEEDGIRNIKKSARFCVTKDGKIYENFKYFFTI